MQVAGWKVVGADGMAIELPPAYNGAPWAHLNSTFRASIHPSRAPEHDVHARQLSAMGCLPCPQGWLIAS